MHQSFGRAGLHATFFKVLYNFVIAIHTKLGLSTLKFLFMPRGFPYLPALSGGSSSILLLQTLFYTEYLAHLLIRLHGAKFHFHYFGTLLQVVFREDGHGFFKILIVSFLSLAFIFVYGSVMSTLLGFSHFLLSPLHFRTVC